MKNSNSSYRTTSVQCVVRITSELKPHGATRLTARRSYRGRTPHARPSILKEREKCSAVDTHPNRRPRPASRGRTAASRKPQASRCRPPPPPSPTPPPLCTTSCPPLLTPPFIPNFVTARL